jgi:GT2 family glycosyltransferase
MFKILIAVPCGAPCETKTMESIYHLNVPNNVSTRLSLLSGYSVSDARNKLTNESLDGSFTHTLFIDSDVIVPENLLENLLCLNADIASGWYPKKQQGDIIPEIHNLNEEKTAYHPITKIFDFEIPRVIGIDGAGFGCTLVKNTVFEKVKLPDGRYFEYVYYSNGKVLSEDLSFCGRAQNAGCTILADTSLRCGHIGKIIY